MEVIHTQQEHLFMQKLLNHPRREQKEQNITKVSKLLNSCTINTYVYIRSWTINNTQCHALEIRNIAKIKSNMGSNNQMHCHQQEPEDVERDYSLLGIDESTEYNITGRLAGTNDDYEEIEERWDQDFHVIEGSAI